MVSALLVIVIKTLLSVAHTLCSEDGQVAFIQTGEELQYFNPHHLSEKNSALLQDTGFTKSANAVDASSSLRDRASSAVGDIHSGSGGHSLNQLIFEPPTLNYGQQAIGVPNLQKVTVSNPTASAVRFDAISGSTVHFHCSFFDQKNIGPGERTTFDVVFLPRQLGAIENSLLILSSLGPVNYAVSGKGAPNPYRLRPIVGARIPINSTLVSAVEMHNPYPRTLRVTEMYASGGDLHLELPNAPGLLTSRSDIWVIPPFTTKTVMQARFIGARERNTTAYIRIRTNLDRPPDNIDPGGESVNEADSGDVTTHADISSNNAETSRSSEDVDGGGGGDGEVGSDGSTTESMGGEQHTIIVPFEIEVSKKRGLYAATPELTFGIVRNDEVSRPVQLGMLSNMNRSIELATVEIDPPNSAIEIDFKPIVLDGRCSSCVVAVAKLRFNGGKARQQQHQQQPSSSTTISEQQQQLDKGEQAKSKKQGLGEQTDADNNTTDSSLEKLTTTTTVTDKESPESFGDVPSSSDSNENKTNTSTSSSSSTAATPTTPNDRVQQYNGKVLVKSKGGKHKLTVPFSAVLFKGQVLHDSQETSFYIGRSPTVVRNITLRNTFAQSLAVFNVTLSRKAAKYFAIGNISEPVVIGPGEARTAFTIIYEHSPAQPFSSYCRLHTNLSMFDLPLHVFSGKVQITLYSIDQTEFDFGVMDAGDQRTVLFAVTNTNPVPIPLRQFRHAMESYTSLRLLGIEPGNQTVLSKPRNAYEQIHYEWIPGQDCVIPASSFAVFEYNLVAPLDRALYHAVQVFQTPYETRQYPVSFEIASGAIVSIPEKIVFSDAFPGKISSQPLQVYSTFPRDMPLLRLSTLSHDPRIFFENFDQTQPSPIIKHRKLSYLGRVFFMPVAGCSDDCYVGMPLHTNEGAWFLYGMRLPANLAEIDAYLYQRLRSKWMATEHRVNSTIAVDTTAVKHWHIEAEAKLVWPKLMRRPVVHFPLTAVGNFTIVNLTLTNPSNKPVIVQLLPLTIYPDPYGLLDFFRDDLPSPMLGQVETNETLMFTLRDTELFTLRPDSPVPKLREQLEDHIGIQVPRFTLSMIMQPGMKVRVRVGFMPKDYEQRSSLLLIRNNLTILEPVVLYGRGAPVELRVNRRLPRSTQPLLFEITSANTNFASCTKPKPGLALHLTDHRTFIVKNTGEIGVTITNMTLNGVPCENRGFRIINCKPFRLKPNETHSLDIAFTPDFTMAWNEAALYIYIHGNSSAWIYPMAASLPPEWLIACQHALPRPHWESLMYYTCVAGLLFLLVCVVASAYLEGDRIVTTSLRQQLAPSEFRPFDLNDPASAWDNEPYHRHRTDVTAGATLVHTRTVARPNEYDDGELTSYDALLRVWRKLCQLCVHLWCTIEKWVKWWYTGQQHTDDTLRTHAQHKHNVANVTANGTKQSAVRKHSDVSSASSSSKHQQQQQAHKANRSHNNNLRDHSPTPIDHSRQQQHECNNNNTAITTKKRHKKDDKLHGNSSDRQHVDAELDVEEDHTVEQLDSGLGGASPVSSTADDWEIVERPKRPPKSDTPPSSTENVTMTATQQQQVPIQSGRTRKNARQRNTDQTQTSGTTSSSKLNRRQQRAQQRERATAATAATPATSGDDMRSASNTSLTQQRGAGLSASSTGSSKKKPTSSSKKAAMTERSSSSTTTATATSQPPPEPTPSSTKQPSAYITNAPTKRINDDQANLIDNDLLQPPPGLTAETSESDSSPPPEWDAMPLPSDSADYDDAFDNLSHDAMSFAHAVRSNLPAAAQQPQARNTTSQGIASMMFQEQQQQQKDTNQMRSRRHVLNARQQHNRHGELTSSSRSGSCSSVDASNGSSSPPIAKDTNNTTAARTNTGQGKGRRVNAYQGGSSSESVSLTTASGTQRRRGGKARQRQQQQQQHDVTVGAPLMSSLRAANARRPLSGAGDTSKHTGGALSMQQLLAERRRRMREYIEQHPEQMEWPGVGLPGLSTVTESLWDEEYEPWNVDDTVQPKTWSPKLGAIGERRSFLTELRQNSSANNTGGESGGEHQSAAEDGGSSPASGSAGISRRASASSKTESSTKANTTDEQPQQQTQQESSKALRPEFKFNPAAPAFAPSSGTSKATNRSTSPSLVPPDPMMSSPPRSPLAPPADSSIIAWAPESKNSTTSTTASGSKHKTKTTTTTATASANQKPAEGAGASNALGWSGSLFPIPSIWDPTASAQQTKNSWVAAGFSPITPETETKPVVTTSKKKKSRKEK